MIKLECEECWSKGAKGFDVITKHTVDEEKEEATCMICGNKQPIELVAFKGADSQ